MAAARAGMPKAYLVCPVLLHFKREASMLDLNEFKVPKHVACETLRMLDIHTTALAKCCQKADLNIATNINLIRAGEQLFGTSD